MCFLTTNVNENKMKWKAVMLNIFGYLIKEGNFTKLLIITI